jgi:hypothetical protein
VIGSSIQYSHPRFIEHNSDLSLLVLGLVRGERSTRAGLENVDGLMGWPYFMPASLLTLSAIGLSSLE